MTTYTAPVEDMMFLFEKLRDNKNYNDLENYKEVSPDPVSYTQLTLPKKPNEKI